MFLVTNENMGLCLYMLPHASFWIRPVNKTILPQDHDVLAISKSKL